MSNTNWKGPNFELSKCKGTWLHLWNSLDQILLSYGNHTSLTKLWALFIEGEAGYKSGVALPELRLRLGQIVICIKPTSSMELHPFVFWLSSHPTEILWAGARITASRLPVHPDLYVDTALAQGKHLWLLWQLMWSHKLEEALTHRQKVFTLEIMSELHRG